MTRTHRVLVCSNLMQLFISSHSAQAKNVYLNQLATTLPRLKEKQPSRQTTA